MDNLKLLKKLGMTEYEARAYLALAKLGPSTVREIVLDSKLPRNKAYEALQKLEDKNKISSLPISPKKYKITNPEIFKNEVEELNKSVSSLIKLIEQPKVTEFKDLFWILKGRKTIIDKLALENSKAEKEILSCSVLSRIIYKNIMTLKKANERKVKIKFICKFEKKKINVYKEWLKTGVEIRIFNEKLFGPLLPRITIHDTKKARLTIGHPEVEKEEDYITLWTESKVFSQMLKNHFMNMWKKSKPIEEFL
jgi:HTH-type transcriptional regulator, sugar sensing transcriptional regulator